LLDGSWTEGFESFLADRFPGRDGFRTIKALAVLDVLRQSDLDGLYLADGHVGKYEKVNPISAARLAQKISTVADGLVTSRIYYSIVPDKSLYASRKFPGYDPALVHQILSEKLPNYAEIDLSTVLQLNDYYTTDLHWDQSRIVPVVSALSRAMGFDSSYLEDLRSQVAGEFRGAYAGQLSLPMPPDVVTYLSSPIIDQAKASYLNPKTGHLEPAPIYQLDQFSSVDPYNLFLSGPQPLIVLENPVAKTDRELFLFRDSFSSSLAPLLIPAYSKITLIDLRYINVQLLDRYLTIPSDADVLFLYSSQVLNNSETLMVPIR